MARREHSAMQQLTLDDTHAAAAAPPTQAIGPVMASSRAKKTPDKVQIKVLDLSGTALPSLYMVSAQLTVSELYDAVAAVSKVPVGTFALSAASRRYLETIDPTIQVYRMEPRTVSMVTVIVIAILDDRFRAFEFRANGDEEKAVDVLAAIHTAREWTRKDLPRIVALDASNLRELDVSSMTLTEILRTHPSIPYVPLFLGFSPVELPDDAQTRLTQFARLALQGNVPREKLAAFPTTKPLPRDAYVFVHSSVQHRVSTLRMTHGIELYEEIATLLSVPLTSLTVQRTDGIGGKDLGEFPVAGRLVDRSGFLSVAQITLPAKPRLREQVVIVSGYTAGDAALAPVVVPVLTNNETYGHLLDLLFFRLLERGAQPPPNTTIYSSAAIDVPIAPGNECGVAPKIPTLLFVTPYPTTVRRLPVPKA